MRLQKNTTRTGENSFPALMIFTLPLQILQKSKLSSVLWRFSSIVIHFPYDKLIINKKTKHF